MWRWAVLGMAALCTGVSFGQAVKPATEVDPDIYFLVRNAKCPAAVQKLNEQLKQPHAEILLFAGAMYENGLCLTRNWDRAVSYYVRASELGSRGARMRLAAGYFDPVNGVDLAAALWWAHQGDAPMPEPCRVSGFDSAMEPSAFVETLQKWPAGRASACAYVGAVTGDMLSDPYYPAMAMAEGEFGTVRFSYQPSEGRFTARLIAAGTSRVVEERHWRVGDTPDRKTDLLGYVRNTSLMAVRRYRNVPTIDPSWTVKFEWHFVFVR